MYVTVGASAVGGCEFFLLSPYESRVHAETLAVVSHFNSERKGELDVGSTLNMGRPWMSGSQMDHLLVSLPYPYGPDLENAYVGGRRVRFLWLLPVYGKEVDLIKNHSLEEFESRMDECEPDILSLDRPAVC
ncbi:suppressor of fused domain protein [Halostreptopolyspora alba]|uniref:suppressor of fused domain protein n=1 Tax=Halostreptopolyspora alba TaxID=2487137 RepID=UPI00268DB47E